MCYLGLDTGKGRGKKHLSYGVHRVIRTYTCGNWKNFNEKNVINFRNIYFTLQLKIFPCFKKTTGFQTAAPPKTRSFENVKKKLKKE